MEFAAEPERRRYPRIPVTIAASLRIPRVRPLRCVIRDVTLDGAMVQLVQTVKMPAKLLLDIQGNLTIQRLCSLAWQEGDMVGLKFLEAPELPGQDVDLVDLSAPLDP